jgi:SAM-dependent methyltransferase
MTKLSAAEARALDATSTNHAHWQDLARVHGNGDDAYYDVEALVAGRTAMTEIEERALELAGGVENRDLLHVQCHIGFDAISFAQRGARVTAVDFSALALQKAQQIAERAGVQVAWLEANSLELPESLAGRFDLAYASIGAICWIGDLLRWMRNVASTLRPGGRLVLVDLHPAYAMLGSREPLVVDFPYSFDGPHAFREPGSYANKDAPVTATTSVCFAHDLSEIVNGALDAGLRVERLLEHLSCAFDPRGGVAARESDGRYRVRLGGASGQPVPMLFTLVASRS